MKNDASWMLFALLLLIPFLHCAPKDPGQLTLVNSGVEIHKISVDGRTFTVYPSNHITKDVSSGIRQIKVDGGESIDVTVAKGLTTLFDTTGLSCYAIVDFSPAKEGSLPRVIGRSKMERIFTTPMPMMAVLGSVFPKKPPKGAPFTRIHQVDCEIIDDDSEIVEEVRFFP